MLEEVSLSQKVSAALVYPADSLFGSYLSENLIISCQVFGVAEKFKEELLFLFGKKNFSFLYWEDLENQPPKDINYVFEIGSEGRLLSTAKKYQAKYLAVLGEEEAPEVLREIKKLGIDGRIIISHQPFGPRMKIGEDFVSLVLKKAVSAQVLPVPGNGLERIYPLFLGDLAAAANRAMFSPGTRGMIFKIFGQPVSCFSFVHLVKKTAKKDGLRVESVAPSSLPKIEKINPEEIKETERVLGWRAAADLEKEISRTLAWLGEEKEKEKTEVRLEEQERESFPVKGEIIEVEKIEEVQKPEPEKAIAFEEVEITPRIEEKPKILFFFLGGLFLLLILLNLPLGLVAVNAYFGAQSFSQARESLNSGKISVFGQRMKEAHGYFGKSRAILAKEAVVFEKVGLESAVFALDNWLSLAEHLSQAGISLSQGAVLGGDFSRELLSGEKVEVGDFVQKEKGFLGEATTEINLAQTLLGEEQLVPKLPFINLEKPLSEVKTFLPKGKNLLYLLQESVNLLPTFLAQNGRATYLVLLQNNMELRPTGGFIGSFGILTFENGRFLDFGVLDVYTADGQLRGHVEPPSVLKEYLGEGGWYLRDSNWDPDFPTSARRAAWFLEKEMGRTVQGVIALNLNLAQNLLSALGEVYLPDYQEKINFANLFERAEYRAEIGSFAGSSQKADFLGALSQALFERIKTASEGELFGLAQGIYKSLEEEDLLVYLNDESAMTALGRIGWSGELKENGKCLPAGRQDQLANIKCFDDYLMIVEANLGVNKSNYFVNRKIEQKIEISSQDKITHNVSIFYENTAMVDAWPGGTYKNYLRVYAPGGSILKGFKIDGEEKEVGVSQERGKTVFAALVPVPVGEKRTVEITYELPENFPQDERVSFLFSLQKQSGAKKGQNSLLISFPTEFKPLLISPAGIYSPGSLLFSDSFEKSRTYRAEFVR